MYIPLRKYLERCRFGNDITLLHIENHACVPDNNAIQLVVLCMNHDSPVCRHWIQPKTCESISTYYTWTSMASLPPFMKIHLIFHVSFLSHINQFYCALFLVIFLKTLVTKEGEDCS